MSKAIETVLNSYQKSLSSPKDLEYFQIHVARYSYLLRQIDSLGLKKGAKILDLGCYPTHLFDILKAKGFELYGVSSVHEPLTHKNIFSFNIERQKFPFKDNSFDLVIFTEVLEHLVSDPTSIFSQIHRILKPSGIMILSTPNVIRIQNIVNLLSGRNVYFPLFQLKDSSIKEGTIYYRHNREYTLTELLSYLNLLNYKILSKGYFISYLPNREKNASDPLLLKTIKYTNYFLMKLLKNRQDTILIIAQK